MLGGRRVRMHLRRGPDGVHALDRGGRPDLVEGQTGGNQRALYARQGQAGRPKRRWIATLNRDAVNRVSVARTSRINAAERETISA